MSQTELELRKKWELKAKASYSDMIQREKNQSKGRRNSRSKTNWQPGHFPNVPDRFRFGAKHNTPYNNNLFYEARIVSENQRIGIPEKHAKKPSFFDRSPLPKTGREREHKAYRYGHKEGFAYIKKKHAEKNDDAELDNAKREKLEKLERMLRESQDQRRDLDQKFNLVLSSILDGVGPNSVKQKNKKTSLSLQQQIEKRKKAYQRSRRRR